MCLCRAFFVTSLSLVSVGSATAQQQAVPARQPPRSVEAESLLGRVKTSQGRTLRIGGPYSGGALLAWGNAQPQARLEIPIQISAAGRYGLSAMIYISVDQGSFSVGLQGQQLTTFDAFSFQSSVRRVEFGSANLSAGTNWLIFVVNGKARRSLGYSLGIDRIEMTLEQTARPGIPPTIGRVDRRPPTAIPGNSVPPTGNAAPRNTTPPNTANPNSIVPPERVVYRDRQVLPATHQERLMFSVQRMDEYLAGLSAGDSWRKFFDLPGVRAIATNQPDNCSDCRDKLQQVQDRFVSLQGQTKYEALLANDNLVSFRTSVESYLAALPADNLPVDSVREPPVRSDPPSLALFQFPSTGTLGYRPLDVGLLDELGGPDLKVWNGLTGDFRAYGNEVSIAYGRAEAKAWQFRWLNKNNKVKRAVWQVTVLRSNPFTTDGWENPAGLVASGELETTPAPDQFGHFEIDFDTLTGWSSGDDQNNRQPAQPRQASASDPPAFDLRNRTLAVTNLKIDTFRFPTRAQLLSPLLNRLDRRTFYVRLVTLDQQGELVNHASLPVEVHFARREQEDVKFTDDLRGEPQGPQVENPPQVWIERYEPYYIPTERCWLITGKNWHNWKVGTKQCKTIEQMYHKSRRKEIKEGIKNAGKFVVEAMNLVSDAWESIQNKVVGFVCNDRDKCETVLGTGLDYGLITLGVPPTVPNFDELCEMGKGRLADLIYEGAVEVVPASGLTAVLVRDMITEEVAERMANRTVEEARRAATTSKDKEKWFRLHPDSMYQDAWVMVAIHNPGPGECTGTLFVKPTRGLFAERAWVPVPRIRPGQTMHFPLVLKQDIDHYNKRETQLADRNISRANTRWWDNYLDDPPPVRIGIKLQGHTVEASGEAPANTNFVTDNDEFQHPVKEPFGKQ